MLRVAFDARWHNQSGVGTYVAELLKAFVPLQSEFQLTAYVHPASPLREILTRSDIQLREIRSGRYSLSSQIELPIRLNREPVDLFHSPFYPMPFLAKCKVVVTMFDLIPYLFPIDRGCKRFLVKTGYRLSAMRADHILTSSAHSAHQVSEVLHRLPEHVTEVALGVNRDHYHSRTVTGELEKLQSQHGVRPPYVVVASASNWHTKNMEGALKAIVAAKQPSLQTVIFGPPDGLRAIADRTLIEKLDPRVLGYIGSGELAALFRNATAFLFPSFYEGFGLLVLEAMACGCPVLSSNVASLPEVAGDGAQMFSPLDIEGMAMALRNLMTSTEHQFWRERSIRQAAGFSWEHCARQTLEVYRKVTDV